MAVEVPTLNQYAFIPYDDSTLENSSDKCHRLRCYREWPDGCLGSFSTYKTFWFVGPRKHNTIQSMYSNHVQSTNADELRPKHVGRGSNDAIRDRFPISNLLFHKLCFVCFLVEFRPHILVLAQYQRLDVRPQNDESA